METDELRWAAAAVAVGVVLAGIVVWGAYSAATTNQCAPPSRSPPLGSSAAWSMPSEETWGGQRWYNSSVVAIAAGLHLRSVTLQIQTAFGSTIAPGPTWNVTVYGATGSPLDSYRWTSAVNGTWFQGGGANVLSGDAFSLYAAASDLSGDNWIFVIAPYGPCGEGGSVSVSIP